MLPLLTLIGQALQLVAFLAGMVMIVIILLSGMMHPTDRLEDKRLLYLFSGWIAVSGATIAIAGVQLPITTSDIGFGLWGLAVAFASLMLMTKEPAPLFNFKVILLSVQITHLLLLPIFAYTVLALQQEGNNALTIILLWFGEITTGAFALITSKRPRWIFVGLMCLLLQITLGLLVWA